MAMVDLSRAPDAFGLADMLREDGLDVTRVPLSRERAEDFEAMAAFADGSSSAPPPPFGRRQLMTADFLRASPAFVGRLAMAQHARLAAEEARARDDIDAAPAASPPWAHLGRVPFGEGPAPALALADGEDASLLDGLGLAGGEGIRLRDAGLAALHPVVEAALGVHPNVALAGGAALAAAVDGVVPTRGADHDLFMWGVDRATAEGIARAILALVPDRDAVLLSDRAITVRRRSDGLNLQIVLRVFRSPDAILHSFDLPACAVLVRRAPFAPSGGNEAWCTARFAFCIAHRTMWLEPGRAIGAAYALRACKYGIKGFRVRLCGIKRADRAVDPAVHPRTSTLAVATVALLLEFERDIALALHVRALHVAAGASPPKTPTETAYAELMQRSEAMRHDRAYRIVASDPSREELGLGRPTAAFTYGYNATIRELDALPEGFDWTVD